MTWRQAVPTAFTVGAMLAGFFSILTVVGSMHAPEPGHHYSRAALLIMMAIVLDGIDGKLARWLKGSSEFGAELDTFVDLTAFGIAPAILVFAVTLQGEPIWRVALPSAMVLSGMVRLARFKVRDPLRGHGGYAGLPITINAAWVALFVFITLSPPKDPFSLNSGPAATLFLAGIVILIALQVTKFRYPKPTIKSKVLIPSLALVVALWLSWIFHRPLAAPIAVIMLALGAGYVFFGPLLARFMQARRALRK
ncbi:MAG: hypothetical protein FJY79_02595 [Candidatus Aminicenantes bacterium]|nr:hypothetical protein [Candidatus Aminicenantes bacterium]